MSILERLLDFFRVESADLVRALARLLTIWLLAWLAGRLIRLVARRIVKAVDDGDDAHLSVREKRGQTIAQLLRSVGRVAIVLVAGMLSLDIFFDIGPLLAGAGIVGLAISFGAQSLVKDILSGFFILLENQFAVGDVIEVAGKSGTVERMTLRVVMLRDLRGVLHIIPNGQMTVVSNQTRGWARAVVEVGVGYDVDVDTALGVLRDEAEAFGRDPAWAVRLDGAPEVLGVESLADSAVMIRTLLRTLPGEQWAAAREFRRRLKLRLDREGIDIPYPQRTIHVRPQGAELR
jgi:small conductance mechanosensitive channel